MKIFAVISVLFLAVVLSGAAAFGTASSILQIPILSDIFYAKKTADLGIQPNADAETSLTKKLGAALAALEECPGGTSELCPTIRVEIEATDVEITSWLDYYSIANPEAPFRNPQIKFEAGKVMASARILEPLEIDLTIAGKIARKDEKSVALELEKVYAGNIPVPARLWREIDGKIEEWLNKQFALYGAKIETLDILEGKAKFVGEIPSDIVLMFK